MNANDIINQWEEQNRVYHYENVKDLEKLVNAIGYHSDPYGNDAIANFLGDNPGALEAVRNWIAEYIGKVPEWRDSIKDEIEPDNDEND